MTVSVSKLALGKPTNATMLGEKIQVFHQVPIAKTPVAAEKARQSFAASNKAPVYAICRWVDDPMDKLGSAVVKLPFHYNGVSSELDDAEMKEIGTLLKKSGKWYVETCLETIELIRRDLEVAKMKAKMMYKGEFGADYNRYIEHLNSQDEKAGRLVTRGYSLCAYGSSEANDIILRHAA